MPADSAAATGLDDSRGDPQLAAKSPSRSAPRLTSIDALRGFVMIIMALDHTRDFFHAGAMQFQPEDLSRTTALLFFTRWITHICAPVFFFTAGTGAYLWLRRGNRNVSQLSRFLWSRGLWLVVLELTVLRFFMTFSLTRGPLLLTILWALGWSMVALGFLVRLPIRVLVPLSLAVIALHNLTDSINASSLGAWAWVWNVLHQNGAFYVGSLQVVIAYPLVPWIFVMALGYCFGTIVEMDSARRRAIIFRIGLAATVVFLVIRAINIYGDPAPWTRQFPGMTVLSFFRCTKYPPSLDFLLMTLGPALILLSLFDRLHLSNTNPLLIFGRVPLFYFLVHFFLIHALTIPFALIHYGRAGFLLNILPSLGGSADLYPANYGYSLGVVYAVWIGVVVSLYPLCLWFARVKERRRDWWLGYL